MFKGLILNCMSKVEGKANPVQALELHEVVAARISRQ